MATQRDLWKEGASCVVLLLILIAATDAQICSVHGSEVPGECTPARNCPRLLDDFQALDLANFIEKHGCGVEPGSGDVLVCCPRIIAASGGISHDAPQPASSCGSKQVNKGALWPFMVGLGYVIPNKDLIAITCNGVLISPQWVLTDPSCFSEHLITMAFFGIGHAEYSKITRVPVAHTRRPNDYDSARDQNAIGLVKLSQALALSDDIQVVCMPPGPDYDPASQRFVLHIASIDDGSVAGGFEVRSLWKHKVDLEECRTSPGIAVFPTLSHICTNGLQACNIPMARPLLVGLDPKGGGYTVLGVGGLTADRCTSDVTTFTSVNKFLPYINRMVNPSTAAEQLFDTASHLLQLILGREEVNTCGRRNVGTGPQFPFIVSLGQETQEGSTSDASSLTYTSVCTGVLLTPLWVLTDARCLNNNAVNYAATAYSRGKLLTIYSKVAHMMTPPDYTPARDHNTVALIKLETPLNYTVYTQPVCLTAPWSFDNSSSLMALSTGYGFNLAGEIILDTGLEPVGRMSNADCIASRFVTFDAQEDQYICTSNIAACKFLANPPIIAEGISGSFGVVGVGGDNVNYCKGDLMAHVRVRPHVPWINDIVFSDADQTKPGIPNKISAFSNNFQPGNIPANQRGNVPSGNVPVNQPGNVQSQKRNNAREGTVSTGGATNLALRPFTSTQSSSPNTGFAGFTPRSTSSTSPYRSIVFPQ